MPATVREAPPVTGATSALDWCLDRLPHVVSRPSTDEVLAGLVAAAEELVPCAEAFGIEWAGSMPKGTASLRMLRGSANLLADVAATPHQVSSTLLGAAIRSRRPCWFPEEQPADGAPVRSLTGVRSAGCVLVGSRAALYVVTSVPDAFGSETRARLELLCRIAGSLLSAPIEAPLPVEPIPGLIGDGPKMRELGRTVRAFAAVPWPVLILGETGTGKEAVARAIHQISRRSGPFVPVNCGAIPHDLAESLLFGHERGAFTGADRASLGFAGQAVDGTLFLDEVGELPALLQAKLLRVLQERSYRPVGSTREYPFAARVVAATHRAIDDPRENFRRDLYNRLAASVIRTPPLRERPEDIPALARGLLDRVIRELPEHPSIALAPDAIEALRGRDWPGNVRELENAIRNGVIWACERRDRWIHGRDLLPPTLHGDAEVGLDSPDSLTEAMERYERKHIDRVLMACAQNKTRAAERLGITRQALHAKLRRWGGEAEEDTSK